MIYLILFLTPFVRVRSEQEAMNALFTGEIHRTTAQHKLNRNSNRSHCVFTVYMDQRSRVGLGEKTIHSKLHLVDLAGSERLKKTMNIPDVRFCFPALAHWKTITVTGHIIAEREDPT